MLITNAISWMKVILFYDFRIIFRFDVENGNGRRITEWLIFEVKHTNTNGVLI